MRSCVFLDLVFIAGDSVYSMTFPDIGVDCGKKTRKVWGTDKSLLSYASKICGRIREKAATSRSELFWVIYRSRKCSFQACQQCKKHGILVIFEEAMIIWIYTTLKPKLWEKRENRFTSTRGLSSNPEFKRKLYSFKATYTAIWNME